MKVLLHAAVDLALPGGLETHLRELATGLQARGHDVRVSGRASDPVPFRLAHEPAPADFDVVHDHTGDVPGALARHPGTVRTLHFCVAAKMATYVAIGRVQTLANLPNWRAVAQERTRARRPGALIAVAERVRRDFARWHGLDPARASVIPNGITLGEPGATRAQLRARWGIDARTVVLLTIGRPDFVKGYDLLARAWSSARIDPARALWVTVGGREAARAPGRLVTGPLAHADVEDWIRAADLGALPSYYEGCSVALLEMLAGRLYTLAHDVGNAAEVIRPRDNGEVVPRSEAAWAGALARLVAAPPARPEAGLPPAFEWAAIVEATERVYRSVARG